MKTYNNFNEMFSDNCNTNKSMSVFNAAEFKKLNSSPIEIEYDFPEDDEASDLIPGFTFEGEWYPLDDFIRCDNPHWGLNDSSIPSYIHAYEVGSHYNPLYIGISDDGEFVDVYERV